MANKDVISSNSITRWGEQPPPEELKAEARLALENMIMVTERAGS